MRFAHSHAVVIGVDAYTELPPLDCAVDDAVAVGDVLEAQGYDIERLVTPERTTAEVMRATFEGLVERLGPDDRLLIYFAGHGVAEDDEGGEPQGFLAPIDAGHEGTDRLLPMGWLYDLVCARIRCRHRLLVLDCCFAGSFQWSATRMARRRRPGAATLYRNRFRRFVESPAAQVLTSAASDQKALDVVGGLTIGQREVVGGHSPFATALLDGLTGAADTDTGDGKDGVLTATELYLYVRDAVEHHTRGRQTPGLWTIKGHVRGEYVFTPTGGLDPDQLPEDPRLDAAANPWPGLVPYSGDQAGLFFGRAPEVDALLARLDPADARWLIAVVAASGTGKSSLARAGLVPRLGDDWSVLGPIRPGEDPTAALCTITEALDDARDQLLVIDQFEEVFTLGCDEAERRAFVDALVELGRRPRLRVLITLRADFEAYAASTALGPHLAAGRFVLGPMTRDGLREVIERPAERRVLFFEPPTLVTRLIDEVVALPGGLPLLSFTLSEMYRAYVEGDATDRCLTAAHYDDLGGVVGALRTRATALLAEAGPAERGTIRRVMLRLVSGDAEQTRRRATAQELTFAEPAEQRRVDAVVERFVTRRLLIRGAIERPDGVREPFVEPAHDALVRGWGELYVWLAEARDTLPLQRAVWRAAQTWRDGAEAPGLLWDADPRLPQARTDALGAELNALEGRFVDASERRRRGRRNTLVGSVLLATALLAAVAVYALVEADRANEAEGRANDKAAEARANADRARQQLLVNEVDRLVPEDPTMAALVVGQIDDPARPALAEALADLSSAPGLAGTILADGRTRDGITDLRIGPGGRHAAIATAAGVEIWPRDGGPPLRFGGRVEAMAFGPGGRFAFVADQTARVVTLADGSESSRAGQPSISFGLSFAGDGARLTSVWDECAAGAWSADAAGRVELDEPEGVAFMGHASLGGHAFSGDGAWLAMHCGGARVGLWPPGRATGTRSISFDEHPVVEGADGPVGGRDDGFRSVAFDSLVRGVALDADGTRIAVALADGTIRVRAVDGEAQPLDLPGHRGSVLALAFTADAQRLVSVGADDVARSAPVGGPGEAFTVRDLGGIDRPPAISPDGRHIALVGRGIVSVVELGGAARRVTLRGRAGQLEAVAFTPDGRTVVAAGPREVRWWPVQPEADPVEIGRHGGPVLDLATSADGRWILTGSADGTARLWPVDAPRPPRTLGGHPGAVTSVALSPDGRRAATGSVDGTVRLWSLGAPGEPVVLDAGRAAVADASFSPDGAWLVAGVADGPAALWQIGDAVGPVATLDGRSGSAPRVAFSAGSDRLLWLEGARVGDTSAQDYYEAAADLVVVPLPRDDDRHGGYGGFMAVTVAALAPNGRRIAAVDDGSLRIYDEKSARTGPSDWPDEVSVGAAQDVAAVAWTPDGRFVVTGADDGTVQAWSAADGRPHGDASSHPGSIESIAVHPSGEWILTASSDGAARLQPFGRDGPVKILRGGGGAVRAAFLPDGGRVVTASEVGHLRLWRVDGRYDAVETAARLRRRVRGCLPLDYLTGVVGLSPRAADDARRACLTRLGRRPSTAPADRDR